MTKTQFAELERILFTDDCEGINEFMEALDPEDYDRLSNAYWTVVARRGEAA